jgi:hypothetical protein
MSSERRLTLSRNPIASLLEVLVTGGRVGLDSVIRFLGDELLVMQLSGVSVV